jgi:hypothetical protein
VTAPSFFQYPQTVFDSAIPGPAFGKLHAFLAGVSPNGLD